MASVLAGCGSSHKFASSFGKRRYMKGYYHNAPTGTVTAKAGVSDKKENKDMPVKPARHIMLPVSASGIAGAWILNKVIHKHELTATRIEKAGKKPVKLVSTGLAKVASAADAPAPEPYDYAADAAARAARQVFMVIALILSFIGILVLLAIVANNSVPAFRTPFLLLSIGLFIVIIMLLFAIAHNGGGNEGNGGGAGVAAPLAELLVNVFFAILSAASR